MAAETNKEKNRQSGKLSQDDSEVGGKNRRVQAMLGRIKGENIEALERIQKAIDKALSYLRESRNGEFPGPLANEMHAIHAGMGRVLSGQQRIRSIHDVCKLLGADLGEVD